MKIDDNGESPENIEGHGTLEPIPGLQGKQVFSQKQKSDPAPRYSSLQGNPERFIMRYGVGHTNLEQFEFAKITKDLGILRDCTVTVDRDHNVVVEHHRKSGIRDASVNPSQKAGVNQQGGPDGL